MSCSPAELTSSLDLRNKCKDLKNKNALKSSLQHRNSNEDRLIDFAIMITDIVEALPNTKAANHIGGQMNIFKNSCKIYLTERDKQNFKLQEISFFSVLF